MKLLKLLSTNARISLVDLSQKLKLTSKSISYRIKQLTKKEVILGYRAILNLNSINYHYYKVDLNLENLDKIGELRGFVQYHPNITFSERTIGGERF